MNPLIKKRIDHLNAAVDRIEETLEQNRQEVLKQHEEKEELLQEQWRQRKRMTTLNHIAEEYDALEAESRRYAEERRDIRLALTGLLSQTRALRGEIGEEAP